MGVLDGKTAIITGASRGIGRAIAIRLAEDGADVVLAARSKEKLDIAICDIKNAGAQAAALAVDLRVPEAPPRLVDFAIGTFAKIDIVVNNAGATKRGEFEQLTDDDWMDGFALKFFGAVRLTRAAWPHLRPSRGSVVNISGIGGRTPGAQFSIGGSVNAAMLSFTKSIAETGIRDGVQVNAVCPGYIRTERFQSRLVSFAREHGIDISSAESQLLRHEQISRIGEPEDVAALVAFIVSPAGRLLHGALIDIDAGATKTI